MTYVAADQYLKEEGRLAFVITQSLFKTAGGGEGFRRFRLGEKGSYLKIEQVDDMVELQPFEAATNRTAIFSCKKGSKTSYPVPYLLWRKKETGAIGSRLTFKEVSDITLRRQLYAEPVGDSSTGSWICAKRQALKAIKMISGQSAYQAREGHMHMAKRGLLGPLRWWALCQRLLHRENKRVDRCRGRGGIRHGLSFNSWTECPTMACRA